jgi:thioesterase domain-containing protein
MKQPGTWSHDELESLVRKLFKEVFKLEEVGRDDDFFEMGGDSLTAEQLSAQILSNTGYEFQMAWLLKSGTPRLIAERMLSAAPARRSTERPPIFAVHGRKGFMLPHRSFLDSLAEGQELRMFQLPGVGGGRGAAPLNRVEDIAAAYIAEIDKSYPSGPVLLTGFCMGNLIAIEMAVQLVERGRQVGQLVLIDPNIPETTVSRLRLDTSPHWERWRSWAYWKRDRLVAKLIYGTSGKSEGVSKERMRRFWETYFLAMLHRKRLKQRLVGPPENVTYKANLRAQAKLFAAFRSYHPRSFAGHTVILSSSHRAWMAPVWQAILPDCDFHVVAQSHKELIRAAGGETAGKLQEACDRALASGTPSAA